MKQQALLVILCLLSFNWVAQAAGNTNTQLRLQVTSGGAVVLGTVTAAGTDELMSVWSNLGRATLMKCVPQCKTVPSLPLKGSLVLDTKSNYKILLAGDYKIGKKASLVLKFKTASLVTLYANITR